MYFFLKKKLIHFFKIGLIILSLGKSTPPRFRAGVLEVYVFLTKFEFNHIGNFVLCLLL